MKWKILIFLLLLQFADIIAQDCKTKTCLNKCAGKRTKDLAGCETCECCPDPNCLQPCTSKIIKIESPDGCTLCFCEKPPCPPKVWNLNCPPENRKSRTSVSDKCGVPYCSVRACTSVATCFNCGNGDVYVKTQSGCTRCECCPNLKCPSCRFGTDNVIMPNGCRKCQCKKPPCPDSRCPSCKFGTKSVIMPNGCRKCSCKKPPCPDSRCPSCQFGTNTVIDPNGCIRCSCKEPPCQRYSCPRFCKYGTKDIDEGGCKKCVCKCGPPICCPKLGPCNSPCILGTSGDKCPVCTCTRPPVRPKPGKPKPGHKRKHGGKKGKRRPPPKKKGRGHKHGKKKRPGPRG